MSAGFQFVEDHGWDLRSIDDNDGEGPLTIGYGGRYLHAPDLEVIVEPLRQILDSRLDPAGRVCRLSPCRPPKPPKGDASSLRRRHPRVPPLSANAGWAIGLAPLRDSAENRAKTNNKYREYAALGIPGIYSDMPVYASSVRHGETGDWLPTPSKACTRPCGPWSPTRICGGAFDGARWKMRPPPTPCFPCNKSGCGRCRSSPPGDTPPSVSW